MVYAIFDKQYNVWWEQNREVVEWLELQDAADSIVSTNLSAVRKDAVISQVENILKVIVREVFRLHILYSYTHILFCRNVRMRHSIRS